MSYEITDAKTNLEIARITSFLSVGYKGESKVTNKPLERGSFFSANKVVSPFVIPISFTITGSDDRLRSILDDLKKYETGTELINITTPFYTYLDGNIESLNWFLREGGATGMLEIELSIIEIRQVTARYTSARVDAPRPKPPASVKNKSDASTQDNGKQQATAPRKSVIAGWGLT